jgi:hypothetical protein
VIVVSSLRRTRVNTTPDVAREETTPANVEVTDEDEEAGEGAGICVPRKHNSPFWGSHTTDTFQILAVKASHESRRAWKKRTDAWFRDETAESL